MDSKQMLAQVDELEKLYRSSISTIALIIHRKSTLAQIGKSEYGGKNLEYVQKLESNLKDWKSTIASLELGIGRIVELKKLGLDVNDMKEVGLGSEGIIMKDQELEDMLAAFVQ